MSDERELLTLQEQADKWEALLEWAGITGEDCVPAGVALEVMRGMDELCDVFRKPTGETEAT